MLYINYTCYPPFPYVDRGMEEAESDVEKEVPNRGDATNQRKPWWYHGWVPSLHGWYVFFCKNMWLWDKLVQSSHWILYDICGYVCPFLTGAKRREFSGMIHWLTINNHPSNPHSYPFLRLAPVSWKVVDSDVVCCETVSSVAVGLPLWVNNLWAPGVSQIQSLFVQFSWQQTS